MFTKPSRTKFLHQWNKVSSQWHKPFRTKFSPIPVNFTTGKAYRGINILLLNMAVWHYGYPKNVWLTFRQAQARGGYVRKGETSETILFWKSGIVYEEIDGQDEPGEKEVFVARAYNVFNIQQCEGIDMGSDRPSGVSPISSANEVYANYPDTKPQILPGIKAVYIPRRDLVRIPDIEEFTSTEGYFSTLFHELIHSTGHSERLNREGIARANRSDEIRYAQEELVAEIGAAFLCALTDIETPELTTNTTAYLQSWLDVFKKDKHMIIIAASQAQKAVDFIRSFKLPEQRKK